MEFLWKNLNILEKRLKFIHIAGTNGKGSTAEMLTNILIKAGYKVGKFMSPHLVKSTERMSAQNNDITYEEMESLIKRIEPEIEEYQKMNNTKVTI